MYNENDICRTTNESLMLELCDVKAQLRVYEAMMATIDVTTSQVRVIHSLQQKFISTGFLFRLKSACKCFISRLRTSQVRHTTAIIP